MGESRTAPDFLPFDATVTELGDFGNGANASQRSSLFPDVIRAAGRGGGWGGNMGFSGTGESSFDVSFTVDLPTPFKFVGDWDTLLGRTAARASVSFTGPGGVIYASTAGPDIHDFWELDGTLTPGAYRLTCSVTAHAAFSTNSSGGAYSLALYVPAPGAAALFGACGLLALRRPRRG